MTRSEEQQLFLLLTLEPIRSLPRTRALLMFLFPLSTLSNTSFSLIGSPHFSSSKSWRLFGTPANFIHLTTELSTSLGGTGFRCKGKPKAKVKISLHFRIITAIMIIMTVSSTPPSSSLTFRLHSRMVYSHACYFIWWQSTNTFKYLNKPSARKIQNLFVLLCT